LKKVEIAIGLLLAAALFIMPSLVRADPETPQTSQPNDDQYDGYEAPKIGSDALTTDRSRASDPWGIAPMPPGYAEEVLPGPLSPTVTASSTEPYPFSALNARVQAIADRLSEDDDDDSPIRNAFVHGPEELDDLVVPVTFKDSVDHYIAHFTIKKRKMFASWLRRARQYAPLLTKILREQDLPEDLVYLAMIESVFPGQGIWSVAVYFRDGPTIRPSHRPLGG
jgi:hypothetical protein